MKGMFWLNVTSPQAYVKGEIRGNQKINFNLRGKKIQESYVYIIIALLYPVSVIFLSQGWCIRTKRMRNMGRDRWGTKMYIEHAIFNSVQGAISEKIGKVHGRSLEIWCFFSNTLKHSVTNFLCAFCGKVCLVSVKLATTEFTEYFLGDMLFAKGLRWISSLHPLLLRYFSSIIRPYRWGNWVTESFQIWQKATHIPQAGL